MRLTNKTEYAIRILIYLGSCENYASKVAEIACDEKIPKQFIARIVGDLKKANIILAFRGPTGGIKLARNPSAIKILDVVTATEGRLAIFKCIESANFCENISHCPLCGFWTETQQKIDELFAKTTIKDLINKKINYPNNYEMELK